MSIFSTRLREAVGRKESDPLVLLGNFEVENEWARGETGLPRFSFSSNAALVNRMDEFAVLLGGPGDYVILKEAPDESYLAHLDELGIGLPELLVVGENDPQRTVTRDALADPALCAKLSGLAAVGAVLAAHGTSAVEEELAARCSIALASPDAFTCKRVNSKVYSRRIADELGLRQVRGLTVEHTTDLHDVGKFAADVLDAGSPVVVKDAFGVSGKGIVVVRDQAQSARLLRMVSRQAERAGGGVRLVVEEWIDKRCDLNYQFTVGRNGTVRFDFVKEALTRAGVHMGHRMPPDIAPEHTEEVHVAAELLGRRLAADGFFGVVGVDAMVGADDRLYPVVEINARNNMSTYQMRLHDVFVEEGQVALADQYRLRLDRPLGYTRVREALAGLMLADPGGVGLVVNNFATVNAAAPEGDPEPYEGRLYGLLVANEYSELESMRQEITRRLAGLSIGEIE